MKILRFAVDCQIKCGILSEENKVREISGTIYEHFEQKNNIYNLEDIKLLAPCQPSKIMCVGLNYKAHVEEFQRDRKGLPDQPVLFMKPSTAVIGPFEDIVYPEMSSHVDYEAELAVVIGKKAKNLDPSEAGHYILGYTCGNDVTARDLQRIDGQWTRAKGFDTFVPLGPWIETDIESSNLRIQLYLNDEVKQDSNTENMIFPVKELVSFISRVMTLLPGDVIMTGTPEGVGPMVRGDKVKVSIEGIGVLENRVV